jgi:hypothetical protein
MAAHRLGGCSPLLVGLILVLPFTGFAETSEHVALAEPRAIVKFAPLLVFQDGERYGLADPDVFIADASLRWSRSGPHATLVKAGRIDAERLGDTCTQTDDGCYRYSKWTSRDFTRPHDDKASRETSGGKGFYLEASDEGRQGADDARVFFERTPNTVTYWFFYAYSYPGKLSRHEIPLDRAGHEGDWERIKVILGEDGSPVAVDYHQHNESTRISWQETCRTSRNTTDCQSDGTHPVVFVAKGSHASYPRAGVTPAGCLGPLFCSIDIHQEGKTGATWRASLRDVTRQPWYGFGGAWGHVSRVPRLAKHLTGPLGPSTYKR